MYTFVKASMVVKLSAKIVSRENVVLDLWSKNLSTNQNAEFLRLQ